MCANMPNQWVTSSYQSHMLFYRAEPLMGSFPSASCRKVSVQRLLRCRIFFCSSIHQSGSGFAATRTVFPNKKNIAAFSSSGKRASLAVLVCQACQAPGRREVKPCLVAGKDHSCDKQRSQLRCCGNCLQRRQGEENLGSSSLHWELLCAVKWEACGSHQQPVMQPSWK